MARINVPIILISVSAWTALPDKVRRFLRLVFRYVNLWEGGPRPPILLSPTGVAHYAFCDPRFTQEDAETLAIVAKNIAKIQEPGTMTKAEIRAALDAAVARVNVVVPEGEDPFAYTLTALNAPAALKMFASVPDGWTHKEVPSA